MHYTVGHLVKILLVNEERRNNSVKNKDAINDYLGPHLNYIT